jgi:lysozyme
MKLNPRLSAQAIDLVKSFEGLRRHAARLPEGGWTIGYGHTASARRGATVTSGEAEALLIYDLHRVANEIDALIFTPINANQFDALVSFAFNVGVANFRRSVVLKRINEGRLLQAASALELWRKAMFEGEDLVLDALVRRRAAEKALFLTPPEGFRPAPTPLLPPLYDPSFAEAARSAAPRNEPAVVRAPLDGEIAVLERDGPAPAAQDAPSASTAAVERVAYTLRQILADDFAPLSLAIQAEPEQGVLEEILNPEPPPPPMAAIWDGEAPVPAAPEVQAPPESVTANPAPAPKPEDPAPFPNLPPPPPTSSLVLPPARWRKLKLVLGAAGLALFGGAILAMFQDRATLVNLLIGLVGIALMTPAAVILMGAEEDNGDAR